MGFKKFSAQRLVNQYKSTRNRTSASTLLSTPNLLYNPIFKEVSGDVQRDYQITLVKVGMGNPSQDGMVAGTDVGAATDYAPRIRRFGTRKVLFLRIRAAVPAQTDRKRGMLGACERGLRGSGSKRGGMRLTGRIRKRASLRNGDRASMMKPSSTEREWFPCILTPCPRLCPSFAMKRA